MGTQQALRRLKRVEDTLRPTRIDMLSRQELTNKLFDIYFSSGSYSGDRQDFDSWFEKQKETLYKTAQARMEKINGSKKTV